MTHEIETKEMQCDGECNQLGECTGEVMRVIVFGAFCPDGMSFNYCEIAREEDRRRGFKVEIMSAKHYSAPGAPKAAKPVINDARGIDYSRPQKF